MHAEPSPLEKLFLASPPSRTTPPWLLGILNVTPDSFSDGGQFLETGPAVVHAEKLIADGAHAIDIGAVATGPGSRPISQEEEEIRILPVVEKLSKKIPLSIDTYRAGVASKCLAQGARIINDVSGLRADKDMGRVIAEHNAFVCIMFSKEEGFAPHVSEKEGPSLDALLPTICEFLLRQIDYALSCGVPESHIIVDPGMGRFLSNQDTASWKLLQDFHQLQKLGIRTPIMVGTSRKGFLGGAVTERDPLSQLTALHACKKGATLIRTHNVKAFTSLSQEEAPELFS